MKTYALLVVGFVIGWIARSVQFAADRDCANPDHAEKSSGPFIGSNQRPDRHGDGSDAEDYGG